MDYVTGNIIDTVNTAEAGHGHEDRDEDGEGAVEELGEGGGDRLGAQHLGDAEGGEEGDVCEEVHHGHQDDGEGDGTGEVPHGIL